jgi:penicillin-binding protein 1C
MYAPKNFDEDYLGPLPAREALAASLNVPAVRLAAEVTPARLLDLLRRLGLKSLNRDANHYGLALALGSGEVQLRELAGAYVALARGGEAVDLRVVGSDAVATGRRVLDPSIAAAVTEALVDPLARTRLLAGRSPFDIGYPLAVKTGTSSGHRDAWTVGFTHERTVVVWVGNADGDAMHRVTGATGGGPLFADIMRRAMQDVPTRAPLWEPAQLELATVCPLSGKRPIEACPDAVPRRFARGHTPQEACDIHVHARRLRSPTHHGARAYACDTQGPEALAVFPPQFDGWLARFEDGAPGKDPHGTPWLPRSMVPGCEPAGANRPTLRVETPVEGAVYWLGSHRSHRGDLDRVELVARYEGPRRTAPRAVEFVIDGNVVASVGAPYRALVDVGAGDHDVYARPTDPDAAVAFAGTRFSVR